MMDFFEIVMTTVIMIALFGVTIFVHELGHFLAAIWSGMVVEVFSIGFGPAIWQKKIKGVVVKIAWVPFGGYVSIPQLDPTAMQAVQGESGVEVKQLPEVSPWKKILVSLAGVTGNVILAVILAWVVYWSPSVFTEEGNTVIGYVDNASEAYQAGIRPGDEIASVNGEAVATWAEYAILSVLAGERDGKVELEVVNASGTNQYELATKASEMDVHRVPGLEKSSLCVVGKILDDGPAKELGLQPRDIIRSFDGHQVLNWRHLQDLVRPRAGETVPMVVERSGDEVEYMVTPRHDDKVACVIAELKPGWPAEEVGLQSGDAVRYIDNVEVLNFPQMVELISERRGKTVPIVVERSGKTLDFQITPRYDEEAGRALIGIIVDPLEQMLGVRLAEVQTMPWMQYKRPAKQLKNDMWHIVRMLKALTNRREAKGAGKGLGGPPMILFTLWFSIRTSLMNAVGFIRFLNINLAVLNMLPIPVLDGGHLVFALWEVVTGRKPHPKIVNVLVNVFAALLIGAILFLSARDFFKMPKYIRAAKSSHVEESAAPQEPEPVPEAQQ